MLPTYTKKTAPPEHRVFRRLMKLRFRQLFAGSRPESSESAFFPDRPGVIGVASGGTVKREGRVGIL